MSHITYSELVTRYGTPAAYGLLLTIEDAAKVSKMPETLDEETRLRLALEALANEAVQVA